MFLDVSTRLPAEEILRKLPSMHHQFLELAGVDITKEPMEVGPTCHYMMGGIEVEPDTAATAVPGLFAAGEVAGGFHGSNRLGGNSLSDLLVFGRQAFGAADYLEGLPRRPQARPPTWRPPPRRRPRRWSGGGENPYAVHADLQQTMNDLVGLIRRESEMTTALKELEKYRQRVSQVSAEGGRGYNPGWHLALDLRNMLLVAECVGMAALERQESRGGHTRDDYPAMSPEWRKVNLICSMSSGHVALWRQPVKPMPPDLMTLFDRAELKKYLTEEELPAETAAAAPGTATQDVGGDARGEALTWVTRQTSACGAATRAEGSSPITRSRSTRARWSWTGCTGCRPPRPATWPSGGTARPASAAPARWRSTGGPGSPA